MSKNLHAVIIGTGSYIPTEVKTNEDFLGNEFYGPDGKRIMYTKGEKEGKIIPNEEIIQKFEEITGIKERRYVEDKQKTSDIAYEAAKDALDSSNVWKESLDYIIFAHNFGDVDINNKRSDFVPSLASRVKNKLGIKNPYTVAYDLPFGCPGWLQGVITANEFLKSGRARRILVIGAETLSRVSDPHDRDSMIYSDGAGATIFESATSKDLVGILSSSTVSNASYMLRMGKSYNPNYKGDELFLKMDGHDLYLYAIQEVPKIVKESISKAGLSLKDIKKILIHQANEKMDFKIVQNLFKLYLKDEYHPEISQMPSVQGIEELMPMTISWLGNSSVATLPTLLDLVVKEGKETSCFPEVMEGAVEGESPFGSLHSSLENYKKMKSPLEQEQRRVFSQNGFKPGDVTVFASVGGGMNINSVVYKVP